MKTFWMLGLSLLLLCTGCEVPSGVEAKGSASLTIELDGAVDRTLLPSIDMNVANYVISGTNQGDGSQFSRTIATGTTSVTVNALNVGIWNLMVSARNAAGTEIGAGSTTATLLANQVNNVTLTASPLVGNGTLNMTFSWPTLVTNPAISAKLTPIAPTTGSVVTLPVTISGQSGTSTLSAVLAGYYTLAVTLTQNGAPVAGGADVVRIVAGQTTQGTYAFAVGGVSGNLSMKLVSNMKKALSPVINIPRGEYMIEGENPMPLTGSLSFQPQGPNGALSVDYSWYVNGVFVSKNTPAIGANSTFYLGGSDLASGIYRVDVLAVATDGSSGSTSRTIRKVLGAQWAQSAVSGTAVFSDVVSDGMGNVYAVGKSFGNSVDFGNGVVVTGTTKGGVIVKYNEDGVAQAAKFVSAPIGGGFTAAAVNESGELVVAGVLGPSVYDFGNGVTANASSQAMQPVVVKISPAFVAQWAKVAVTSPGSAAFNDVAINDSGEAVVVGSTYGSGVTFGGGVSPASPGSYTVPMVVKFGATGTPVWAQTAVSATTTSAGFRSVALDDSGNIYAAGYANMGSLTLATGVAPPSTNVAGGFLAKLNSAGVYQWASGATSASNTWIDFYSVAVDGAGNPHVSGKYANSNGTSGGSLSLGSGGNLYVSSSNGNSMPVLAKYNPSGTVQWAKSMQTSAPANGNFEKIAFDVLGNIVVGANLAGTGQWQFSNLVAPKGTVAGDNFAVFRYTPTGTVEWAQLATGTGGGTLAGLVVENSNHIYIAGSVTTAGSFSLLGDPVVALTGVLNTPLLIKY